MRSASENRNFKESEGTKTVEFYIQSCWHFEYFGLHRNAGVIKDVFPTLEIKQEEARSQPLQQKARINIKMM